MLALFLGYHLQAQIYYSEDFSTQTAGSAPAGFTILNEDACTPNAPTVYTNSAWITLDDGAPQGNCAKAQSWSTPVGCTVDDWLITPAINLTGAVATTTLSWSGKSNDSYLETYEVLVSTTNTLKTSFSVLTTITDEPDAWTTHSLSLSAYVGGNIYLAFRLISSDEDVCSIDDILVSGTPVSNLSLENTNINGAVKQTVGAYIPNFVVDFTEKTNVVLTVDVKNTGGVAASSFMIESSVSDETGTITDVVTNTVNATIAPGAVYTYTLPAKNLSTLFPAQAADEVFLVEHILLSTPSNTILNAGDSTLNFIASPIASLPVPFSSSFEIQVAGNNNFDQSTWGWKYIDNNNDDNSFGPYNFTNIATQTGDYCVIGSIVNGNNLSLGATDETLQSPNLSFSAGDQLDFSIYAYAFSGQTGSVDLVLTDETGSFTTNLGTISVGANDTVPTKYTFSSTIAATQNDFLVNINKTSSGFILLDLFEIVSATPCSISTLSAGTQSVCDPATNFYTQDVTVTYTNAPATGTLDVNGQSFPISSSPQTLTLSNLTADGAAVNVTASFSADAACSLTSNALFTAPVSCFCPAISVNISTANVTNCTTPNGSATAVASGGAGSYTYAWSPSGSGATLTNLASGVYTVVATDANGCTGTANTTISNTSGVNASVASFSAVSCFGGNDGSISISASGGAAPITYTWSDQPSTPSTMATRTNLTAGTYTVTVADNAGCSVVLAPVTITEPNAINISLDAQNDVNCFGDNDGSILVSVSGGTGVLNYNWDNAANTEDVLTATAGTYQLSVTDANNCVQISSVYTINEPAELLVTIADQTNITCNGANNGTITATVSGGTGIYTNLWTNGAGTSLAPAGLAPNSYQLSVSDANNCNVSSAVVTLTEPTPLAATVSATQSNANANTGTATAVATGGTAPYTYLWTDAASQSNSAATGLAQGTYTCTITDVNNCTTMVSTEVGIIDAIAGLAVKGLAIYPNPTNGLFTITFESKEKLDFDLKVMNTIGKVVYTNTFQNISGEFKEQFDFSNFTNGIYFIALSNKNMQSVERITLSK